MNIVFESAPEGATHRYQHSGEISRYREIEGSLFVNGGMLTLVKPEDIADAILAAGFKRDGGAA